MKILICTGIYPPQIGGPAQYAKEIASGFKDQGHKVRVLTYKLEKYLPPLIRHALFFLRTTLSLSGTDLVVALDTFSVGWPATCASILTGKKILIRTGGDFLWESYVERTGNLVYLRDFYKMIVVDKRRLNQKEKIIFSMTKFTLQSASAIVFSTKWQKQIFEEGYDLDPRKSFVVENYYGPKQEPIRPDRKVFLAGTRKLKWKNIDILKSAFDKAKAQMPDLELDTSLSSYEEFLPKIQSSYATILVSLGDISPNMILDAVRFNKPFILTKETGLYEKLKDIGLFVDPMDVEDIKRKIIELSNPDVYSRYQEKVRNFSFTHSWGEICEELIKISEKV